MKNPSLRQSCAFSARHLEYPFFFSPIATYSSVHFSAKHVGGGAHFRPIFSELQSAKYNVLSKILSNERIERNQLQ